MSLGNIGSTVSELLINICFNTEMETYIQLTETFSLQEQ